MDYDLQIPPIPFSPDFEFLIIFGSVAKTFFPETPFPPVDSFVPFFFLSPPLLGLAPCNFIQKI